MELEELTDLLQSTKVITSDEENNLLYETAYPEGTDYTVSNVTIDTLRFNRYKSGNLNMSDTIIELMDIFFNTDSLKVKSTMSRAVSLLIIQYLE